jgi:hypothetical protein
MSSKKESRGEESEEKGARGNERGEGCARGRVCEGKGVRVDTVAIPEANSCVHVLVCVEGIGEGVSVSE